MLNEEQVALQAYDLGRISGALHADPHMRVVEARPALPALKVKVNGRLYQLTVETINEEA